MIKLAIIFLVIGLVLSVLGFGGIGGAFIGIAKFLGILALVVFAVLLVLGLIAGRSVAKKL